MRRVWLGLAVAALVAGVSIKAHAEECKIDVAFEYLQVLEKRDYVTKHELAQQLNIFARILEDFHKCIEARE